MKPRRPKPGLPAGGRPARPAARRRVGPAGLGGRPPGPGPKDAGLVRSEIDGSAVCACACACADPGGLARLKAAVGGL